MYASSEDRVGAGQGAEAKQRAMALQANVPLGRTRS
jgi:hypothetical protein